MTKKQRTLIIATIIVSVSAVVSALILTRPGVDVNGVYELNVNIESMAIPVQVVGHKKKGYLNLYEN